MTGNHSIPPSSLVYRHSRTNLSLFLDISSGYVYVCACYVSRCQTLHTLEDALVLPNASSWEFMSHFLTLTEATINSKPKVRNPVLTFRWGKLKFHSFSQSPAGLSLRLFSDLACPFPPCPFPHQTPALGPLLFIHLFGVWRGYMCTCSCVCQRMCVYPCGEPEDNFRFPGPAPLLFKTGPLSHWSGIANWAKRLDWLAREPQECTPPALDYQQPACTSMPSLFGCLLSVCVLRVKLRSSWWQGKHSTKWAVLPAMWFSLIKHLPANSVSMNVTEDTPKSWKATN